MPSDVRRRRPSDLGWASDVPELERVPAHLVAVATLVVVHTRLALSDGAAHPLHQTARKVNHLLGRLRNYAEREDPVAALGVSLSDRVRPVLIEQDEELHQARRGVDGEEEGRLRLQRGRDELWRWSRFEVSSA
jgi:hypothetical protein